MNHVVVGHCPRCGAPIYMQGVWGGIVPPPNVRSCACFPDSNGPKTYVTPNTGSPPPKSGTVTVSQNDPICEDIRKYVRTGGHDALSFAILSSPKYDLVPGFEIQRIIDEERMIIGEAVVSQSSQG